MAGIARTDAGVNVAGDRFVVDIETGTTTYVGVMGVSSSTPIYEVDTEDVSDQGSGYWKDEQATVRSWGHELELRRKHIDGEYDPGQELIRVAAQGDPADNVLTIRVYERNTGADAPKVEAWTGKVTASWEEQGGGQGDKAVVKVVLTGRGPRVNITHPDAA